MQNRGGNATRHWHGAAATTLTGSLRRFVTGDPATAALGGTRTSGLTRGRKILPHPCHITVRCLILRGAHTSSHATNQEIRHEDRGYWRQRAHRNKARKQASTAGS